MSDENVRLSKRMAELGLCTRREADEFIEMGLVKVDGQVVDTLGSRVRPDQKIELMNQSRTQQPERVTILLNKPAGVDCVGEQGASRLVVAKARHAGDLTGYTYLKKHQNHLTVAPWLDEEAEGLLVLTQDGRLARKLIEDEAEFEQEFLVWVDDVIDDAALERLKTALSRGGKSRKPAKASRQSDRQLRLALRSSSKGQVFLLCDQAGLTVQAIKRIRIGRIALGDLAPGQWRYLGPNERF
jgi:23S rRNA pseudouridine2604 synthase